MIHLVYSPTWFQGKDIIIDIISIIVLLLVGLFAIKSYRVRNNRNYLYLAVSFFLVAVSFIFKILMNFSIYYHVVQTQTVGQFTLTYQALQGSDTLFVWGFFLYRILTLLGFYLLYAVYQKQDIKNHLLLIYLLLILTIFTDSAYYVFHITQFLLLILIIAGYRKNIAKAHPATVWLVASFGIIALSQLFFMQYYVIGEIVQLIGYVSLLITFIMVLRHGKKNKD